MTSAKGKKEVENKIIEKMSATGSYLEKFLGDISKKSATKQIVIGSLSGWATGYSTMKIGKTAAFLIGGGIIFLEIANEQGWIKIDWNKVTKQIDKAADKVEEVATGEGPRWIDKAERYVDRKLDQAESALKKKSQKAKKWYSAFIGDENGPKINEFHIFLGAFVGGYFIGAAMS